MRRPETGHDTLLLAQSVGETGRVWAFDVQSKALVQTQGRLKENGVDGRVALIHDGHENLLSLRRYALRAKEYHHNLILIHYESRCYFLEALQAGLASTIRLLLSLILLRRLKQLKMIPSLEMKELKSSTEDMRMSLGI